MLTGALAALLVAGCSTPARTTGDPAPSPAPPATARLGGPATPAGTPSEKVTRAITGSFQFSTPSKNIGCYVAADSARCDIARKSWKAPAKPADCELDYGNGVGLFGERKAAVVCAGDTVLGGAEILPYGHVVRAGSFVCDSESSGVRCTNEKSGHGFTLSRQAYTVF